MLFFLKIRWWTNSKLIFRWKFLIEYTGDKGSSSSLKNGWVLEPPAQNKSSELSWACNKENRKSNTSDKDPAVNVWKNALKIELQRPPSKWQPITNWQFFCIQTFWALEFGIGCFTSPLCFAAAFAGGSTLLVARAKFRSLRICFWWEVSEQHQENDGWIMDIQRCEWRVLDIWRILTMKSFFGIHHSSVWCCWWISVVFFFVETSNGDCVTSPRGWD